MADLTVTREGDTLAGDPHSGRDRNLDRRPRARAASSLAVARSNPTLIHDHALSGRGRVNVDWDVRLRAASDWVPAFRRQQAGVMPERYAARVQSRKSAESQVAWTTSLRSRESGAVRLSRTGYRHRPRSWRMRAHRTGCARDRRRSASHPRTTRRQGTLPIADGNGCVGTEGASLSSPRSPRGP